MLSRPSHLAVVPDTPEVIEEVGIDWPRDVTAAWKSSLAAIIRTGELLIGAKAALPHGQFTNMIKEGLPFGPHTARRLMAIARHPILTNRAHALVLPPVWFILYELTQLPDEEILARIADGRIHPEMGRGNEDDDEEDNRPDPSARRPSPKRLGADFWPTPDSLIQAACQHVLPALPSFPIWECACGDGRLGRALGAQWMTDKYPQDDAAPLDFLTDDPPAPDLIAFTNQPFNAADKFLKRGLKLLDAEAIRGFVLLLRHDHFMAGGKVEALNRAILEVHCNWRPIWIEGTAGSPRWAFSWVYWGVGDRQPPLYLREKKP